MSTISGGYVALGVFIEIIFVPLILKILSVLDIHILHKSRITRLIMLAVLIIIPVLMGISDGCSIKEGDYSEHTCCFCSNPASCKLKTGNVEYFCSEHTDWAYEYYERYTNTSKKTSGTSASTSSSKKCKSCEKSYTDSTNKKYISHTNMCKNCYRNYCILSGETPKNYG